MVLHADRTLISLTPRVSAVISREVRLELLQRFTRVREKPLKRFFCQRHAYTPLKRGVNETGAYWASNLTKYPC